MPRCAYCVRFRRDRRGYPLRPARHARDTSMPRCDRHWRYVCAVCGKARHFNGVAWCPREDRFVCLHCAPAHRRRTGRFGGWAYAYRLRCPWRNEWHVALDRAEYDGTHPWSLHPSKTRRREGMSRSEAIEPWWSFDEIPAERVTDGHVRQGWNAVAEWWVRRYSEKGDVNREWVIDPLIFEMLGDVRGRRILDAGCGYGYLARALARRGARVDGVDLSPKMIELARRKESEDPTGARFRVGNLAKLSGYPANRYDVVVANVVVQDVRDLRAAVREIARVLRPGGRFVFSTTHPAFELPPSRWIIEPEDSERIEDRLYKAVDRYFDRTAARWSPAGEPPAILGFHRPLRDFFEALREAGLLVSRLEEPLPSPKALRERYREFADFLRIPLFLVIEAVKPRRRTRRSSGICGSRR